MEEPLVLSMRRDVFGGYEEKICVSCDNLAQIIEYDNLLLKQIPNPNSNEFPLLG